MEDTKSSLIRRLRKIEGQVKGIQRMIDEEKQCIEILTQIAAVRSAINAVGAVIVENHTKECILSALETEDESEKVISDLVNVLSRFSKG